MNNKKFIPKVVFKQMPLEPEAEMISGLLDWDWSDKITGKYPPFLEIKKIKSKKKKDEAMKNEIIKIRQELGQKMDEGLLKVKSDWQKVEAQTLKALSEIIQVDYPKKEITAYISINPICPRHLDDWWFSVPPDHDNPNKVFAHEISHFLFFKKLKEEFPEIKRKNYESPHKEWILSEIIAVIILNDKRITDVLDTYNNGYYPKHRELKIDGKSVTETLEKLYDKYVVQENNFQEFIKKGLVVVKDLKL